MQYNHNNIDDDLAALDPSINENLIIKQEYENPFYVPIDGSNFKFSKIKFLIDQYKHANIMCLADDFEPTENNKKKIALFYEAGVTLSELKTCCTLVTIVRAPMAVLFLEKIRSGLCLISDKTLEWFNNDNLGMDNEELVYLMMETNASSVRSWLDLYQSNIDLDKFIRQKIFSSYYGLEDSTIKENLIHMIGQVDAFKYWHNKKACQMAINNSFMNRKFNLQFMHKWNLPLADIEKELKNILQNFKDEKSILVGTGYPQAVTDPNFKEVITDPLKRDRYVDGGSTKDNRSFYGLTNCDSLAIKFDCIKELLCGQSFSQEEKYHLLCSLVSSKDYCHYVLASTQIMTACKDLFQKYNPVFKYLMTYAWSSFYIEESMKKTKICQTDRFVLDLETASSLPVFPFSHNAPHLNPYFTCFVSEKLLNLGKNINGVKQPVTYQKGIVDLAEFKRRLNVFINGDGNNDILAGANWTNMAITGGCMAAIMPKLNPLMALYKKTTDPNAVMTDGELDRFFAEYYSNSDVDIACNHDNILDFIKHVLDLKNIIQSKLPKKDIKVTPAKTLAIYINATCLKQKCESGEIPFGYDFIIANKNRRDVKLYFYEMYLDQKKIGNSSNKQLLGDLINDEIYFEIVNCCDFKNSVIVINNGNFEIDEVHNKRPESNSGIQMVYYVKTDTTDNKTDGSNDILVKFSETLKYKISSKQLKHPFEVFRINSKEYFSCVARFHLPCVRSYYNGTTCYLLPSAITAYHTFTNIDFKYFVGKHDPINILDKYRKRGYGTLLNATELSQYLSYIMSNDSYKKAYGAKDTTDTKKILGPLDITNDFFKPRKNLPEEFSYDSNISTKYMDPTIEYLNTKEDIIKFYQKTYPSYPTIFAEKQAILKTGHLEPLKKWFIDASYETLNQSN